MLFPVLGRLFSTFHFNPGCPLLELQFTCYIIQETSLFSITTLKCSLCSDTLIAALASY